MHHVQCWLFEAFIFQMLLWMCESTTPGFNTVSPCHQTDGGHMQRVQLYLFGPSSHCPNRTALIKGLNMPEYVLDSEIGWNWCNKKPSMTTIEYSLKPCHGAQCVDTLEPSRLSHPRINQAVALLDHSRTLQSARILWCTMVTMVYQIRGDMGQNSQHHDPSPWGSRNVLFDDGPSSQALRARNTGPLDPCPKSIEEIPGSQAEFNEFRWNPPNHRNSVLGIPDAT
jgi:hypothetical protein